MTDEAPDNFAETSPLSPLCAACGAKLRGAKFCPECGKQVECGPPKCAACGVVLEAESKFCPECGATLPVVTPPLAGS